MLASTAISGLMFCHSMQQEQLSWPMTPDWRANAKTLAKQVLVLLVLMIFSLSGRMSCTYILCWSQYSGQTPGLTYLLNVSSTHMMSSAWSEPTVFFAKLILKRTISADIWTIPAISPAVLVSNERKNSLLVVKYVIGKDLPLGIMPISPPHQ